MNEDRKKTIETMVENYYAQVRIVENYRKRKYLSQPMEHPTDITLVEYLSGIGINTEEIEYAKEYDLTIPDERKTAFK